MFKPIFLPVFVLCLSGVLYAQSTPDTLEITSDEAEAVFLERNLKLLAGKLEINESEALLTQARVWPNPTISIDEVNLWTNHGAEELGRLTGDWGNHAQASVNIEQLIRTAGKRKKAIALAKTGVAIAEQDFADLLQSLRLELRTQLATLFYTQKRRTLYRQQLEQLRRLLTAYQRQVQQGNVGQSTYLRLKASELELMKTIDDIHAENSRAQQALSTMLGSPEHRQIVVDNLGYLPTYEQVKSLSVEVLTDRALKNQPALKTATLQLNHAEQQLAYERAQRVPDLAFSVGYDRGGNIMRDFIGLGVSMDLPLFDKNKGNIRAAQAAVERRRLLADNRKNEVKAAVLQTWHTLQLIAERLERFDDTYDTNLDKMADSHHRNFASRNIGLLEYLDFMKAYLASKDLFFETNESLLIRYETLQYRVGGQLADK